MDRALQPGDQGLNAARPTAARPDVAGYELGLAAPLALFFLAFFAAPLVMLVLLSLQGPGGGWGLSQYAQFLSDPFSLGVLGGTLWLGVKVTLLCLLLGYPVAWLYSRSTGAARGLIVLVVLLPLLTSVVVRTFAWIVILGRQGIVNSTLLSLGLADAPLRLLYSEGGVVVALARWRCR